MNIVFTSQEDYVRFMTGLPIEMGEIACLSFLPSVLFPKDVTRLFFDRYEPSRYSQEVSERLWRYGKTVFRSTKEKKLRFVIEENAIRLLCETGQVHEATPDFQLPLPARLKVLEGVESLWRRESLAVSSEPLPYVFRLHPPSGVLLDVRVNTHTQLVQGIWIEDRGVYDSFEQEAMRLWAIATKRENIERLGRQLKAAMARIADGQSYPWGGPRTIQTAQRVVR